MFESLRAGKRVTLDRVGIFADGVAVRRVGEETFRLAKQYVDEILLVTTDQICAAIQDIFEDTRSIAEPAGALAVAGIKKYVAREACADAHAHRDQRRREHELRPVCAMWPSAPTRARSAKRCWRSRFPKRPVPSCGFANCSAGAASRSSITDTGRAGRPGIRRPRAARGQIRARRARRPIGDAGFAVHDMTDNEMAKLHVRYMVGGHARGLARRASVPLRISGTARRAVEVSAGDRLRGWNISLFHYRNHGSDYGRVLAGIQVPPGYADRFLPASERTAVRLSPKRPTIRPTRSFWAGSADSPALRPRSAIESISVLRAPRHETMRVRGLDMHLTRWGPSPPTGGRRCCCCTAGRIPAILFSSWWTRSRRIGRWWRPTGAASGAANGRGSGYWFPDYLADLDALLEQLVCGRAGASGRAQHGRQHCRLYAGLRPERVRCLVNLEGFGLPRTPPDQAPAQLRKWLDQVKAVPALKNYESFEQLASIIRLRYPRFSEAQSTFIAQVWAKREADGRVHLLGDARHRWVNPVLYRREEAEACWRADQGARC